MSTVLFSILVAALVQISVEDRIRGPCAVIARTESGRVCGTSQEADGFPYASFLNVPYAKQPLGELRFKELEPAKPWNYLYDATREGPICPQFDIYYGRLMTNRKMSEACIHANIYVPMHALPEPSTSNYSPGLPVLVFIHGGGFVAGSGEPDLYGPEYLIKENVIIITFNTRLNVFGYLSLNSQNVPGNNGLRDALSLLRWVNRNARFFGGNPDEVTLGGQSAGATSAHLLSLSKASRGLFKRVILMSGVGIRSFFTTSPEYAKNIASLFLHKIGITETDPEKIYNRLIKMPVEVIINASAQIQISLGRSWAPVIESKCSNQTLIIDRDPEELVKVGRGKDIPLLIGFTNMEGQFSIPSYRKYNRAAQIEKNPLGLLSPDLIYKLPKDRALEIAYDIKNKYFNNNVTNEKYGEYTADSFTVYSSIKLAHLRASGDSAPVHLYQFAYDPDFSAIKVTKCIKYEGAAHVEDLTFIFKTNSLKDYKGLSMPTRNDAFMRELMTGYVKNFMTCSAPICGTTTTITNHSIAWPAERPGQSVKYENIAKPTLIEYSGLSAYQRDMVQYNDKIYNEAKSTKLIKY